MSDMEGEKMVRDGAIMINTTVGDRISFEVIEYDEYSLFRDYVVCVVCGSPMYCFDPESRQFPAAEIPHDTMLLAQCENCREGVLLTKDFWFTEDEVCPECGLGGEYECQYCGYIDSKRCGVCGDEYEGDKIYGQFVGTDIGCVCSGCQGVMGYV